MLLELHGFLTPYGLSGSGKYCWFSSLLVCYCLFQRYCSTYQGFSFYFMIGKFKVVTLCGSTRFKEQFIQQQKRLTLEGYIVISVGLFGHSGDNEVWSDGTKEMLDEMHLRKIDMADEIFVINVGGYIGESTKREIEYAASTGKIIKYLE